MLSSAKVFAVDFVTTVLWAGPAIAASLHGTSKSDHINGTKWADAIYTRNGNDTIEGNKGNDVVWGQGGDEQLYGGPGPGRDQVHSEERADRIYVFDDGDGIVCGDRDAAQSNDDQVIYVGKRAPLDVVWPTCENVEINASPPAHWPIPFPTPPRSSRTLRYLHGHLAPQLHK